LGLGGGGGVRAFAKRGSLGVSGRADKDGDMSYTHTTKFDLKQKVKARDSGAVGHVMGIEIYCDAAPTYHLGRWVDDEFKIYKMDEWQLEPFEERTIGI